MKPTNTLINFAIVLVSLLAFGGTQVHAALPCNINPVIYSTAFSDQATGEVVAQPLMETLAGVRPADREGATVIDYDTPRSMRFRVVSAGENVLRCLDYGQSEVLAVNATPGYRFSQFGLGNDVPDRVELVSDLDATSVYTERVENPLLLANGLYLVDFTARHNNIWLTGEMVFEMYDDDLYLASTYLSTINPATGESHSVVVDIDGLSADSLMVHNGDLIGFGNELDENIRIEVTSDETGEVVFRGGNLGKNFAGPAPKSAFYVGDLEPGTYTATVTTDGGEELSVLITVEP